MARTRERVLLSWSGGKDSTMALQELRRAKEFEVIGLLSAIYEDDERVTLHGVGRDLLEAQARAVGLPLTLLHVPKDCDNRCYNERLGAALAPFRDAGLAKMAFGDLFLDDIRDFREESLAGAGMEAVFPLWHRCTKELSWSFINHKFKAVVTCIDETTLTPAFVGRTYDKSFLGDLPLTVDPCGENGEFHTFVYDGPLFAKPVPLKLGGIYRDGRFHYCEVGSRAGAVRPTLLRARSV